MGMSFIWCTEGEQGIVMKDWSLHWIPRYKGMQCSSVLQFSNIMNTHLLITLQVYINFILLIHPLRSFQSTEYFLNLNCISQFFVQFIYFKFVFYQTSYISGLLLTLFGKALCSTCIIFEHVLTLTILCLLFCSSRWSQITLLKHMLTGTLVLHVQ